MEDQIAANRNEPFELERLFRSDREGFSDALPKAIARHPDSLLLKAWQARLEPDQQPEPAREHSLGISKVVLLLSAVAGLIAKIPFLFSLSAEHFYAKNASFVFLPALAAYFHLKRSAPRGFALATALVFFAAALYINVLPGAPRNDTFVLACLHLPLFLWVVAGVAFTNGQRDSASILNYLQLTTESIIYAGLIAICGVVMFGITTALFRMIGLTIDRFYIENIVVVGLAAAPIIAVALAEARKGAGKRIAPVLAKLFAPLAFVTLIAYLASIAIVGKSPYTEREFLITFNALLLCVLAIGTLLISERNPAVGKGGSDLLAAGLLLLTVIVDCIALSAIMFRLGAFGLTPNRLAVLGVNIVILGHLFGMLAAYRRFLSGGQAFQSVRDSVARYMPVYGIWTAIVAFAFPLIFGFK